MSYIEHTYLRSDVPESGVTANMPALGAGDSGFESRLSDREQGIEKREGGGRTESGVTVTYTIRVRVTPGSIPGSPTRQPKEPEQ